MPKRNGVVQPVTLLTIAEQMKNTSKQMFERMGNLQKQIEGLNRNLLPTPNLDTILTMSRLNPKMPQITILGRIKNERK